MMMMMMMMMMMIIIIIIIITKIFINRPLTPNPTFHLAQPISV